MALGLQRCSWIAYIAGTLQWMDTGSLGTKVWENSTAAMHEVLPED